MEAINALIAVGATIDAQTAKQSTPLHFAAQNGHTEAIDALLAAGASQYDAKAKLNLGDI
jgi:ankyrin repeat protein